MEEEMGEKTTTHKSEFMEILIMYVTALLYNLKTNLYSTEKEYKKYKFYYYHILAPVSF